MKTARPKPEPPDRIDRDAYQPAYAQLADILRGQVARGRFLPGDRLPSEAELCRTYQVSPMTVRRAVNILADQDVVRTVQGLGTFVKPLQLGAAAFQLRELQDLFSDPDQVRVKLLDVRMVPAGQGAAAELGLSPGDKAIFIRRLLLVREEPAFYHREYLVYDPGRPVVEAEMEVTSLRGLFSGAGDGLIKGGRLTVEAVLLDEEALGLLAGGPGPAAGLRLEHVFYDFDDRPVSWGWFLCRSDRLRLSTRVGYERAGSGRPGLKRGS
ncbi:MAG: GntR family transcriptional regulator [Proteobacteria bacterium]|nr:GntR family transcriptional regulator [Pseudomonadota bacterium]